MTTSELGATSQPKPSSGAPTPGTRWLEILGICAVPALYAIAGVWQIWGRYFMAGHQWWADPEHTYLLSGLLLISGGAPWFLDHPGIPLKLINAAVESTAWNLNFFATARESIHTNVVTNAEGYLVLVSSLLVVFLVGTTLYAGLKWVKQIGFPATLVLQSAPLFAVFYFPDIFAGNRPEVLLVALSMWALGLVVPTFGANFVSLKAPTAFLLGAVLGVAVATKLSMIFVALLLPPLLRRPKSVGISYVGLALTFAISLIPIWLRIPAFVSMSLSKNSREGGLIANALATPRWISEVFSGTFAIIGIYVLLLFLTAIALLATRQARGRGLTLSTRAIPTQYLIYGGLSLAIIYLQYLFFVTRWFSWFVIPLFPIVALGLALLIQTWGGFISSKNGTSAQAAFAVAIVGVMAFGSFTRLDQVFPLPGGSPPSSLGDTAERLSLERTSAVVYDYSVTWSHSDLGRLCSSLINGSSFAREVVAKEVIELCPNTGLAGFGTGAILPMAPHLSLNPEAPLRHALYCADLARFAGEPGGLHIVTPDRDFTYINATTVTQEGGWRLSKVNSIDCTGSPVRNETPNPATLAARGRIVNMPIIGFLYRNWPWQ